MEIDASKTVGDIVAEAPATARVFERLRIDYCCHGRQSLSAACAAKGLSPEAVLRELGGVAATAAPSDTRWTDRSMTELVAHLVATHHAFTVSELERGRVLGAKVVAAHKAEHPEVVAVMRTFEALREELLPHLQKEEVILFPYVRAIEGTGPAHGCFASVAMPIRVMDMEHDAAGRLLETLRAQTGDYALPADACPTWRAFWDSLQALEADLHTHIHLESNVLFPRAVAAESATRATQTVRH